jgi:hypothetical protein
MDAASAAPLSPPPAATFRDGLGERHQVADRTRTEVLEILCLRNELTAVPAFEFALRERVSHLAAFHHACFGRVRTVERLKNPAALGVVSEATAGVRLSELLSFAERTNVTFDIDAALCLLRQLVPALAMMHENAPGVAHGAIAAERIVVTPAARIVVVEHVLGSALAELKLSADQYWRQLRIALPGSAAPPFDHRSDVTQLGAVALGLILGRPLRDEETPSRLGDVVASAWAHSSRGGLEPLPAGLRAWLMSALQLDAKHRFDSAIDAQEHLERLLGESEYMAAPTTLEAFLATYRAATETSVAEAPARPADAVRHMDVVPAPPARPLDAAPRPKPAEPVAAVVAPPSERVATIRPPQPVVAPASDRIDTAARPQIAPVAPKPAEPSAVVVAPVRVPAVHHDPAPVAPPSDHLRRPLIEQDDEDEEAPIETAPEKKSRWPLIAAGLAVVIVAGAGVPAARRYMAPAAPAEGTLTVTTAPAGAHLFVDGVERGTTPLTVSLNPGAHALELRGEGAPRTLPITITAGAQLSQYIELPTTAATTGQLLVRTEPAGARISVDGVARGTTPVTIPDLAAGDHVVALDSDLGSVKQTVTVVAGNTASLVVPLGNAEGVPVSGWIAVAAPADVQLFENGRLLGSSQSDRLMVAAGRHEIEVVNEALGYRATRTVQVPPGKVLAVRVDFPKGAIALNATPWAEVWADGEKVGDTPIGNLQLTIGPHDFVFRHPELGEQRHSATITLKTPARLSVDMRKK